MSKKFRLMVWIALVAIVALLPALGFAQDIVAAEGAVVAEDTGGGSSMGLFAVIASSGWLGYILWAALLGCSVAAAWLRSTSSSRSTPRRSFPKRWWPKSARRWSRAT